MHVHIVVATGPVEAGQRSGLVTDAVQHDFVSLKDFCAYFCGAPAMVEALNTLAKNLQLDASNIHADAFYPSGI